MTARAKARLAGVQPAKQCGLCGKAKGLTRTECCGNWICDDTDQYVLFSYARNSCYRNHDRYTLCAGHHHERHTGSWKSCKTCMKNFETEMYVWYGTNEYNFEILKNPPRFKPTRCADCKKILRLPDDGYSITRKGYVCQECSGFEMPDFIGTEEEQPNK